MNTLEFLYQMQINDYNRLRAATLAGNIDWIRQITERLDERNKCINKLTR